jgi:multidrug efflux pump
MIAVPVSLVGTFAVMALLGFSLNNLSLFGLVLAIGIVVDDAIVVVENVERHMAMGKSPRDAARAAMDEVTGPVIAIALVLCAVFVPTAFMAGISGEFYKQFALTIAASTVISAFNSLTLSPALCAILLKPHGEHEHAKQEALPRSGIALLGGLIALYFLTDVAAPIFGVAAPGHGEAVHGDDASKLWAVRAGLFVAGAIVAWILAAVVNGALGVFFRGFNWGFDRATNIYGFAVGLFLRLAIVILLVYAGLIGLTVLGFRAVPGGFIPEQDKGYLVVNAQLPDGASLERSDDVVRRLTEVALKTEGVGHTISVPGYSILTGTNIPNVGGMFVILEPFEERAGKPAFSANQVIARLREKYREIEEAQVVLFGAPPIDGLGSTGGFKMQVQDRSGAGPLALQGAVGNVIGKGNSQPGLVGLFSSFSANQPQLYVDVDRVKAKKAGVSLNDVFDTLQVYLGSAMSTTSRCSTATGKSTSRRTLATDYAPKTSAGSASATRRATWCPWRR